MPMPAALPLSNPDFFPYIEELAEKTGGWGDIAPVGITRWFEPPADLFDCGILATPNGTLYYLIASPASPNNPIYAYDLFQVPQAEIRQIFGETAYLRLLERGNQFAASLEDNLAYYNRLNILRFGFE